MFLALCLCVAFVVASPPSARADRVAEHESWLLSTLFAKDIAVAWQLMTEQMNTIAMYQMQILGNFWNARNQLDTQMLLQRLAAEAHKDYRPSVGMCTFGTNVRALAGAEQNGALTAFVLGERSQDRQLGNKNVNASFPSGDKEGRLAQFRRYYCDKNDNNLIEDDDPDTGLSLVCDESVDPKGLNKDIDFARTLMLDRTLAVDFSDDTPEDDERDVMALANNLYGHNVFPRVSDALLSVQANLEEYMDVRAVIAKRSVVENSYNALAALKTAGTGQAEETAPYMEAILEHLGVPSEEIKTLLGGSAATEDDTDAPVRPSYLAQMEILSKKIYQDPSFYMTLYDTPANVRRTSVAMQAIGSMLDRDLYNSHLRSEALMALWLELRLLEKQQEIENAKELVKAGNS
ncbi:MAG: hypothetical protein KDJ15_06335 [Alphaproteobacteria bacterium]|nr:hypothetical protein [Alphaproteobacteria bacterium]